MVALIQQVGYPKAVLIGSLAKGRTSLKDIDVLIPLRTRKQKQQCVAAMRELFNPNHMAAAPRVGTPLDWSPNRTGVIDISSIQKTSPTSTPQALH